MPKVWIVAVIALVLIGVFLILAKPWTETPKTSPKTSTVTDTGQKNTGQENTEQNEAEETQEACEWAFKPFQEPNEQFEWHNLSFKIVQESPESTKFYGIKLNFLERHGLKPLTTYFYLRSNPFKLEQISSDSKMPTALTYISYDKSVLKCNTTALAGIQLGYWLGLLGVNTSVATTEPGLLERKENEQIKSCEDANENTTVIVLQAKACQPFVRKDNNCIILEAGSCYVLEVAERFILDLIEQGIKKGSLKLG